MPKTASSRIINFSKLTDEVIIMGLKNEFKHEMKKALHDVNLSVTKTWEVPYENQLIRVENSMNNERLFINDELVDEVTHLSLLSHLKPYSILTGTIKGTDGRLEKVAVKIGGFIKLSIQIKVGKQIVLKEKMSIELLPWAEKESIVHFIEQQITEHARIIDSYLPDTEFMYDADETTDPGYLDYIGYEAPLPFFEKGLVKQIKQLLKKPTTKRRRIIYEKVNDEHVVTYGAKLLYLLQEEQLDNEKLQEEALWFLEHAAHREVVKFALLLLGVTNVEAHKEKLYMLALHEEFTSYALLGISHLENDAHNFMWKLANELSGWGKVAVMHHLTAITPEEKQWFLQQYFSDETMNEAVALIIAETAELDVLLTEDMVDETIFFRINAVLFNLLKENEQGERIIDDYQFAPLVLKRFAHHARNFRDDTNVQQTVGYLKQYVSEDDTRWDGRFESYWAQYERDEIINQLKEF